MTSSEEWLAAVQRLNGIWSQYSYISHICTDHKSMVGSMRQLSCQNISLHKHLVNTCS